MKSYSLLVYKASLACFLEKKNVVDLGRMSFELFTLISFGAIRLSYNHSYHPNQFVFAERWKNYLNFDGISIYRQSQFRLCRPDQYLK